MSDSPALIRFPGALGTRLAARLDSPPGEPLAVSQTAPS